MDYLEAAESDSFANRILLWMPIDTFDVKSEIIHGHNVVAKKCQELFTTSLTCMYYMAVFYVSY